MTESRGVKAKVAAAAGLDRGSCRGGEWKGCVELDQDSGQNVSQWLAPVSRTYI